ncbi:MAG: type II secretion system protein [Pseudomonadota bacterium]
MRGLGASVERKLGPENQRDVVVAKQNAGKFTLIEVMIVAAVFMILASSLLTVMRGARQFLNAFVLDDDVLLMFALVAVAVAPIAYIATHRTLAAVKGMMAVQRNRPARDADAAEKAAFQAQAKPHKIQIVLAMVGGAVLCLAAVVGVLCLNTLGARFEREVIGQITLLEQRSSGGGSGSSRSYHCRVGVDFGDSGTLTMTQRRGFCRDYEVGQDVTFARHAGTLGLRFYRFIELG